MENLNLQDLELEEWREWVGDKDLRGPVRDANGRWWLDRRFSEQYAISMGYRYTDWSLIGPDRVLIPESLYDALGLPKQETINYTGDNT